MIPHLISDSIHTEGWNDAICVNTTQTWHCLYLHYKSGDRKTLREDAAGLEELLGRVKRLRAAHRQQWMENCSPFGWFRLDLRYGGLMARLETVPHPLGLYLDGSLPGQPEQETPRYEKNRRGDYRETEYGKYIAKLQS